MQGGVVRFFSPAIKNWLENGPSCFDVIIAYEQGLITADGVEQKAFVSIHTVLLMVELMIAYMEL